MKAKNKCVFLDRDGTIIVDGEYNADVNNLTFISGVIKGLKKLQNEGFLLVIITNQSGIARGYNTENDVITFNNLMVEKLKNCNPNLKFDLYEGVGHDSWNKAFSEQTLNWILSHKKTK